MEETVENHDVSKQNENVEITIEKTNNVKKMHKCNQCMYASYYASQLKTHKKKHTVE